MSQDADATQHDDTECVCQHPRSDHGDGVVHTACCGLIKVPAPSGDIDAQCECEEFTAIDWAEAFASGPGRIWAIPEPTHFEVPAGCRLTEADLAIADADIEARAQVIDLAFSLLLGANDLGDTLRAAWTELRPLLEQRLCDCDRNPHHRWNCTATPIWAQTIRDLDTNPWTVLRGALVQARSDWFDEMVDGWPR